MVTKTQDASHRLDITHPDVSKNEMYETLIKLGEDADFATSVGNETMKFVEKQELE
jgi:hypothetical protein